MCRSSLDILAPPFRNSDWREGNAAGAKTAQNAVSDFPSPRCDPERMNHPVAPLFGVIRPIEGGRVIELLAESEECREAAAQKAVSDASETLRGVASIYIKEMEAKVEDGQIIRYRVNAKLTFEI